VDCALEPRSVVAANVAIEKNKGTFNLEGVVNSGEEFNEICFKTAFGASGLGMPLRGFKSNISNLTAYTL
jgi:processing peptidase subunit beta